MNTAYRELIQRVDELATKLSSYYSGHLACRAGCSGCCRHHLSVFRVEAAAIQEAIDALPETVRSRLERQAREASADSAQGSHTVCPLLVEDRCAVYSARPLICRTQGLPLLFESGDGEKVVDFCPLNFT